MSGRRTADTESVLWQAKQISFIPVDGGGVQFDAPLNYPIKIKKSGK